MGRPSTGSERVDQAEPSRSSASSQAIAVCWSSQLCLSPRSICDGQVHDSSPDPASQAADETEVASRTPVPSGLLRTGRSATVTTTAKRRPSGPGSARREGSSPWPVEPCSTVPSAAAPTRISQRGPVKASSRPYQGKPAIR